MLYQSISKGFRPNLRAPHHIVRPYVLGPLQSVTT